MADPRAPEHARAPTPAARGDAALPQPTVGKRTRATTISAEPARVDGASGDLERAFDQACAEARRLHTALTTALAAGERGDAPAIAARLRNALRVAADALPYADDERRRALALVRSAARPLLDSLPAPGPRRVVSRDPAVLIAGASRETTPPRAGGPAGLPRLGLAPAAGHVVTPVLERQLLAYLRRGTAPLVQFENLLFLGLDPADGRALHARLTADPPPRGDALASEFRTKTSVAERTNILGRLADFNRANSREEMWSQLAPGETSEAMQLLSRVDAPLGVHLRSGPDGPKDGPRLPLDTLVSVTRRTSRGWYWVTALGDSRHGAAPSGASGFIEAYHVASHMPEPTAHLHHVKDGELLKDIAARHYAFAFAWGNDARVYVQAIYHANKDRDAVYRRSAEVEVDRRALSTSSREEALELWKRARVVRGQALWIPSVTFVDHLKAAGVIHHASLSKAMWDATAGRLGSLLDGAQYAAGFALGLLEGAWGALEDLFEGAADLVKLVWSAVKGIGTGFSELRELASKLGDAFSRRRELADAIATSFMAKWESSDDWARGSFQGEVIGYVVMLALIAAVTLGAGAVAGVGRFGDFARLLQLADVAGGFGTYIRKVREALALPARTAAEAAQALGKRAAATSAGRRPDAAPTPHAPDSPAVADAPDAREPRNRGGHHADPREDPRLPHRYLEKHELLPTSWFEIAVSWKHAAALLAHKPAVAMGRRLTSPSEGHDLVARLARGDAAALEQLGIRDLPPGFDSTGREWALIEGSDGCVLVAGQYSRVEYPVAMRSLAHSHPGTTPATRLAPDEQVGVELPAPESGRSFDDLVTNELRASALAGLTPSARDIHAISGGHTHVLYTRFVHAGGGRVASPRAGDGRPRIQLHLSQTRVVHANERIGQHRYLAEVAVQDSTGQVVWRGTLQCDWFRDNPDFNSVRLRQHS